MMGFFLFHEYNVTASFACFVIKLSDNYIYIYKCLLYFHMLLYILLLLQRKVHCLKKAKSLKSPDRK